MANAIGSIANGGVGADASLNPNPDPDPDPKPNPDPNLIPALTLTRSGCRRTGHNLGGEEYEIDDIPHETAEQRCGCLA